MRKVGLYSLLFALAPSQAIMIDDFASGPFNQVLSNQYISQSGLPTSSAIGGTRAVHAFNTGGFLQMTCTAGGTNNLVLNTINSSLSDLFWMGSLTGGTPPSGAGTLLPTNFVGLNPTVDLSASNFFRIGYSAQSSVYQVNLHVYNANLSESVSSQFIPVPIGTNAEMFVSFNVFSGGGVYDIAGGFRLGIEGLGQGFLTIHEFEVLAVPEPAGLVFVGAGLLVLATRRRFSSRHSGD